MLGHSFYEDPKLNSKLKAMCNKFKNIILLLPDEDIEKSRQILIKRRNIKLNSHKDKENFKFLTAKNNYELATSVIYEHDKEPIDIAGDIYEKCSKEWTLPTR